MTHSRGYYSASGEFILHETYRGHRTEAKKDHASFIWSSGWFYPGYKDETAVLA